MRAQHIPAKGGSGSRHPIRDIFIGILVVLGAITISPALETPARDNPSTPDQQSALGPSAPDNQILNWTVARQKGFNSDWNCWMLQLHRTYPNGATDGDFCTKDKADYDSHPIGSKYQTHGDWLDNILQGPRDNQPESHPT